MIINFDKRDCQTVTNAKKFGICDTPSPNLEPAYIDSKNGENWIATVFNYHQRVIKFTAIDHCAQILSKGIKMKKTCDAMMRFDDHVLFIELKERSGNNNQWINEGIKQLESTIQFFESTDECQLFTEKKAFIANNKKRRYPEMNTIKIRDFKLKTGYALRITPRIVI